MSSFPAAAAAYVGDNAPLLLQTQEGATPNNTFTSFCYRTSPLYFLHSKNKSFVSFDQ
jgi:hypothetical protein